MRYMALATDYDGTLATDGRISHEAASALERLRASGRRVILATGRTLEDLQAVCPRLDLFDYVVAENGGVLYDPRTKKETVLAARPPDTFIQRLKSLGVTPLQVGRVVVATWLPHHHAALQAIQESGLELHIVFNRAAVMILPTGVSKASGMEAALRKLGLSSHEVVGVGDAANDHSFLLRSECPVAVADAEPSIRKMANVVTRGGSGHGITEVVDRLIKDDLKDTYGRQPRHRIRLGLAADGSAVSIPPYGSNILIAGPSGTGKTTVAVGIIERLIDQSYQTCIVDPEGDYGTVQEVISLGSERHAVKVNESLAFLEDPHINLNINLLGIPLADRPNFFCHLLPNLQAMRTRTARPHWIVLDEAHHMMPPEWVHLDRIMPQEMGEVMLITVHPSHLAPSVLSLVDVAIAVGPSPEETLRGVAKANGRPLNWPGGLTFQKGNAVVWFPRRDEPPFSMKILGGRTERIRHHRKYAVGDMRLDSFYFTGPDNRHSLKAQNLVIFSQIADGIGEETWLYHLRRGDYSRWFRSAVKDNYLADHTARIEQRQDLSTAETRKLIRGLIEARYTLPE
jgi:HAD superfamily hydrolase (TIGR01484 family)